MKHFNKLSSNKKAANEGGVHYKLFTPFDKITTKQRTQITKFLLRQSTYSGYKKAEIEGALLYAMQETSTLGGFVVIAQNEEALLGAAIVVKTGMDDFLSSNMLVFFATNEPLHDKGIAKYMIRYIQKNCSGDLMVCTKLQNKGFPILEAINYNNIKYVLYSN